ncbi:CRISPR-associated helicase Cas3' [Candidatus Poribacteria bacterium]|nr:MAG: CRISPR-associated helicase Cas3' [Candidatus Poribacteria bacterium]
MSAKGHDSMQSVLEAYQQIAGTKFAPNPMQDKLFALIAPKEQNPALLLKAPTGSGKTEAVLVPSLVAECPRRLFLIFPSRSLVEDQIGRCTEYLRRASEKPGKSYALVADIGGESERTVFKEGKELEKGNRHLYDGDVILTTFDKFLYRFFGFGEPKKSYIYPFRIHHSHQRNLFCFDEVHSYDGVAFVNFERLIKALYKANLDMVVMTATMPDAYQEELDFLDKVDYTTSENQRELENWQEQEQKRRHPNKAIKRIAVEPGGKIRDEICASVSQWYNPVKRTIVTIETIKDLIPVYQYMKERSGPENIFLYHGRLSNPQRKKIYRKLKNRENNNEGYLLFTTSAIEVGCDLDSHLLITELCNPDQLIQRAGRCNRKGKIQDAEIIVVGNKIRLSTISQEMEEEYLQILQKLDGDKFSPDAILKVMTYEPHSDYRAEVLFDMLYEYVYEARLENKPLHDRGLVITRSFEPSITLTTKLPESPEQPPKNAVSVSLQSCIANAQNDETVNPNFKVYQRFYNDRNEKFEFVPLSYRGSVYFKELFVEVPESYFDKELGYFEPPTVFEYGGISGYRQNFVYNTTDENGEPREIWLHYLRDLEKSISEDAQLSPQSESVDTESSQQVETVELPPEDDKQLTFLNLD